MFALFLTAFLACSSETKETTTTENTTNTTETTKSTETTKTTSETTTPVVTDSPESPVPRAVINKKTSNTTPNETVEKQKKE